MDIKQNKQLVMQAYEHYKNRNIAGVMAMMGDGIEWTAPDSELLPFAGSRHGKDEVAQFFASLEQSQDVLRFEPQTYIAEGDKVAVIGAGKWRVKATGVAYDSPWVHVFTIRDGKIVRFEEFNHTAAAEAAYRPAQAAATGTQQTLRH